jgi:lipopolysaccharide export system protein LptA
MSHNKFIILLLFIMLAPNTLTAQTTDLDLRRLPWDIFAETMVFDGKTSTYIYTNIKFSQGTISIESNEGRATLDQNNSGSWIFSDNVKIDVDNGKIECDSAELLFDGNALIKATVTGNPATFSLKRNESNDTTYAEAKKLSYDVQNGIIEFSEQAAIKESNNEISSSYFIYDINERRINADSLGVDDDRVRITYTPLNSSIEEEIPVKDESQ